MPGAKGGHPDQWHAARRLHGLWQEARARLPSFTKNAFAEWLAKQPEELRKSFYPRLVKPASYRKAMERSIKHTVRDAEGRQTISVPTVLKWTYEGKGGLRIGGSAQTGYAPGKNAEPD